MSVNSAKRVVDIFLALVKINSTSRNEAAVRVFLLKELRRRGCQPSVDKKGNIQLTISGALANGPVLLFNAHMDTVVPGNNIRPRVLQDRIVSDGTTVLGADDKAGVAALLELLTLLKEKKVLFHKLKIILTVEEEIGLHGAKALRFQDVQADYCFVLDSDGEVGSVVNKAPAQETVEFRVRGRAAHAGLEPEAGISAIKIAAAAISRIKTGRIDSETTANIGIIKGGSAGNIVPDETLVKAEARSHSEPRLQKQLRSMRAAFQNAAQKFGGAVEITSRREYDPVRVPPDAPIIKISKMASRKMRLPHRVLTTGGGSDASVIFGYGVPTIGLCIGMERVHTRQEYITLRNLTLLPKYLLELIKAAHSYERLAVSK
ncbi:MAG: M20/M25/M40 family metallo-hydrolase [Candidatus Margulisbacteria bacterium]|jgi:tripeptide aminopeptidase|nr:M20/M25/M40 family metallo-hydrolase [Candidatus Margulisiibacteriota bacterium]